MYHEELWSNEELWSILGQLYNNTKVYTRNHAKEGAGRCLRLARDPDSRTLIDATDLILDRGFKLTKDEFVMDSLKVPKVLVYNQRLYEITSKVLGRYEELLIGVNDIVTIDPKVATVVIDPRSEFSAVHGSWNGTAQINIFGKGSRKNVHLKGSWKRVKQIDPALFQSVKDLFPVCPYLCIRNSAGDLVVEYDYKNVIKLDPNKSRLRFSECGRSQPLIASIVNLLPTCNVPISELLVISVEPERVRQGDYFFIRKSFTSKGEYTLLVVRPEAYDPHSKKPFPSMEEYI